MTINCVACELIKRKVRPAKPPKHTCARGKRNYKEPEKFYSSESGALYKVHINHLKHETQRAGLYSLKGQYLNGFRVKNHTDLWVPDFALAGVIQTLGEEHFIYIKESFYLKLAFM